MRRLLGLLVVTLLAAGCGQSPGSSATTPTAFTIRVRESPSPFQEVTAGPVRALVPDGWRPMPAGSTDGPQEGFVAAPRPRDWTRKGTPQEGMAAVWVDGARVGIPSDYYYLAATGPALELVTGDARCRATSQTVFADHLPTFAAGPRGSPGDFIARGQGTCRVGATPTRWAYFVAAPGYGPVGTMGIPRSGLYLVVALVPDSPSAPAMLDKLLLRTQFGGASISDFIAAARAGAAA